MICQPYKMIKSFRNGSSRLTTTLVSSTAVQTCPQINSNQVVDLPSTQKMVGTLLMLNLRSKDYRASLALTTPQVIEISYNERQSALYLLVNI